MRDVRMRSGFLSLGMCSFVGIVAAPPEAIAGPPSAWVTGDAARLRLEPWRHCADLRRDESIPWDTPGEDDEVPHLRLRRVASVVEVVVSGEGDGRDGIGWMDRRVLRDGRCDAIGTVSLGLKEEIQWHVRSVAFGGAPLPSTPPIEDLFPRVRSVDHPSLAAARLVALLDAMDDDRIDSWPVQPDHPHRPTGSPPTLWLPKDLRAIGVATMPRDEMDDVEWEALSISAVRAPRLLRANARFEVWELRWRARNGGGLIAIYDKARDRHRWVWGTHEDAKDWSRIRTKSPLDWHSFTVRSFNEKEIVLRIEPDHGDAWIAIHIVLASGRVRTVEHPRGDRDSF